MMPIRIGEEPLSRQNLPTTRPTPMGMMDGRTVTHMPSATLTDRVGHVVPGQGHHFSPGRVSGLDHSFSTTRLEHPTLSPTHFGRRHDAFRVREEPMLVTTGGHGRHAHLVSSRSGFSGWGTTLLVIAAVFLIFPVLLIGLVG
ncbi:hypothetical protein [Estrella lausannensis]|uniref:Putative membrane protein n=1 Tax=Estrella lausannensis TaxID=483423 RepID=A0A0H5E4N5_9BACT|nr:hypothetical protein [Estrella lausannensis]CRX38195.1 putative membrane protein [Estrella lausannensis]